MSLLSKEKALIENDYFQVWEIVEMLSKGGFNLWGEVGEFLGHHNFDTELTLYCRDSFHRMHEVRNDYAPIRNLIHGLHVAWLEGEESIQKIKIDIIGYYWAKHEIFNFKPIMDLGIIEKPQTQVVTLQSVQESRPDKYKFFLYKQPLFSIDECACIISDYDPLEIQKYPHNDIDEIAPDYSRAYSFISSAIEANKLNVFNYKVDADGFREYLASENIIIAGFNDQIAEPLYAKPTQARAEFEKINASLELDLAIEKNKVKKLNEEIDHLKAHIAELESKKMQFLQKENATNDEEINLTNSDLLLISVLLRMLQNEIRVKGNKSQSKILLRIEDEHRSIKGLSKSRTEKVLANANSLYKALINNQMK
ncbi:hypothetical protein [Acinetobacter towneri]|uniref:hypothetical protein n=1 Tax=Acinetobacter towneri TaxID=202956 RepID=UPI003989C114